MKLAASHLITATRWGLLLLSLLTGCDLFEAEPPPLGVYHIPAMPPAGTLQVAACSDSAGKNPDDPIAPVLIAIANGSQTAWTIDASQISVADAEKNAGKWLPIPAEEAARMAYVNGTDKWALIINRGADFAAFGAGLGAAGGVFAAQARNDAIDNGFELGAAYGAVIGGVAGMAFEYWRLNSAYETEEAGEANEKMKLLALQDQSTLYSNDAKIGYVYFSGDVTILD